MTDLRTTPRWFDMDIRTVVNVRICGESRPCIILDKKTYFELTKNWISGQFFLFKYDNSDFRTETVINIYSSIQFGKTMCYEILYGDKKVWVTESYLKEASL